MAGSLRIGTAGWTIPRQHASHFGAEGSHLERYARGLDAVEINSTFYKPHRPSTYARWRDSVPEHFRFSVKLPREITHKRRLVDVAALLDGFLADVAALGDKLGPLLVQLPPSLQYDRALIDPFLTTLRARHGGLVACEPRHATWFTAEVDTHLAAFRVARVAADPAVVPAAAEPGGWPGLAYWRLHGSPRMYYSGYSAEQLDRLAHRIAAQPAECWCIFDNTTLGEAAGNASDLAATPILAVARE